MDDPGLIVVGSGPAGVSAAESFRKIDPTSPVTILTADAHPPYARPPLSKEYLRGSDDDISLHPREWYRDRQIKVLHLAAVTEIDPQAHTVRADDSVLQYRRLVLANGATPAWPPFAGYEYTRTLRSRADADQLRLVSATARSAVVVGAGFIGCEAAASLSAAGLAVTLAAPEGVPHAQRLGEQVGRKVLDVLNAAGVEYAGGVQVRAVSPDSVHLADGRSIPADLVLAATGVVPNGALAAAAGLATHESRIVVGSDMSTSTPDIFAAGDVALAYNRLADRHLHVEHWQDAVDQGAIAGASAAGHEAAWDGVPGFWSTIGTTTLKYQAWGDGYDESRIIERENGFAVWYEASGAAVGVLTCNADEDYERGGKLIAAGRPAPSE